MELTKQEQAMLDGKEGYAVRKSMEILVALGEIFGAKSLIDVGSVQVAGVSYHNLGDAGLEFLDSLAEDGRVKVLTTLNPAGMDLENWQQLGISPEFAEKQNLVIDAFTTHGHTNQLHLHTLPNRQPATLRRTHRMVRKQRSNFCQLSFGCTHQP